MGATGGIAPYEYSINNGPFIDISSFENLTGGSYLMTIRDQNGCITDTTLEIVEPLPLELIPQVTNVDCYGASTGEVILSATGGTPDYRFGMDGTNFFY